MNFFVATLLVGTMAFAQAHARGAKQPAQVAKAALEPETKSARASGLSRWIGQKPEVVAKKMGLKIRENWDVTSDGTYGLEAYGTRKTITTVFFVKSSGKTADGSQTKKVLDVLVLPSISKHQFFSTRGKLNEEDDDQLFGIGINDKIFYLLKKSKKVWRANVQSETIESISKEGVTLVANTLEGCSNE